MSYRQLYKSLVGDIPKLPEPKAQELINEALRQIYDHYLWHFLLEQNYIIIPDLVATGLISVTRGLTTATPNAAAKAVLDNFGLLPPLTDCQLRIGIGQPYFISAYDSLAVSDNLTLDRPYLEDTNPTAAYSIYRAYFRPPLSTESGTPSLDFVRFKYIHNREPAYKPLRTTSQDYLNRIDPTRDSKSEPLCYAPLSSRLIDGTRYPFYEFWPHPTTSRNLFCIYQRRGKPLVEDEDEVPQPVTEELVKSLARYKAYEWADSHKGEFKSELLSVNWSRKRSEIMDIRSLDGYPQLLGRAIKQDREIFLSSMLSNYYLEIYGQQTPGGNYYVNHAIAGGYASI